MKTTKSLFLTVAAILIAVAAVRAGMSAVPVLSWPHFGYDDQMTSYAKLEKTITVQNVKNLKRIWGNSCDDGYFSVVFRCPALFKGKLFATGAGTNLGAYTALSGDPLWSYGDSNMGWAPQPVLTTDGTVILLQGASPTSLSACNYKSGGKIWDSPVNFEMGFEGAAYAIPAVDEASNAVYIVENPFGPGQGKLWAMNKKTGKVLWYKSKTMGGLAFRGNTVLLKGSWVFATVDYWPSGGNKLARINAKTRKVELLYDNPGGSINQIGWATLCNDWLIIVYHDRDDVFRGKSQLSVYNVNSAHPVWQKVFTTSAITGAVAANTDKNVIYVPTNPYLYAYNVKNGAQVWRFQGYDSIYNPSIANGVIYFLSETNLYAINETNKKKLFRYPLGEKAEYSTQVAIANGMLFFSGNGGTCDLFALGFTGGTASVRGSNR